MSDAIQIELVLDDATAAFEPGAPVSGTASWRAERPPRSIEVRLFWYTRGEGQRDLAVVDVVVLAAPQAIDRRPFSLLLPAAPPSFRGRLLELVWAVEVVALPREEAAIREITVGPAGRAIDLTGNAG
ncbi:MAG TPA: hypothetical protein VHO67_08580 [Polyangia bacterium]|nr:hypothetical protein [Polyangia bacterium]